MTTATTFHAITHVWGRAYLDLFLNLCIPNQLAPGNVPALPHGSRYRILTRSIHVEELDAHPMVHALRRVIPVDLVVVDALDRQQGVVQRYDLMIACHQEAVREALEANAAILFLSADFIFSEQALAAIVRRHREGYRAVVNTGLRVAKEGFLKALEISRAPLDALSSRELVRIAFPYLHQHERDMCRDARPSSAKPVAVYWRVGDHGLLARCFHLHPLMVDPMVRKALEGTNDGHYLSEACPDFSRIHVVTDSDELQMFELTPADRIVLPRTAAGISVLRTARQALECDDLQIRHWRSSPIRIHAREIDERWHAIKAESDAFAASVLRARLAARVAKVYRQQARRWSRDRRQKMRRHANRRWLRIGKRSFREIRIAWSRARKMLRKIVRQSRPV